MNRQSQQLVVAGVVAFLTSGIITLTGLSAAQEPMMGGGFQGGGMQGGDMGGGFQGGGMQGGDMGGFQKDGQNFHLGAPDFGGKEGADRGFRGGFEQMGQEGAERAGGRFGRQPGMEQFGGQQMTPGNVEKAGGGLRTRGNFGGEGGMFKMGEEGAGSAGGRFKSEGMEDGPRGRFGDFERGMKGDRVEKVNKVDGGEHSIMEDDVAPHAFLKGGFGGDGNRGGFDTSAFDKFMQGRGERGQQSKEVSEKELNALDEVLGDDESGITAQEALDALKAATVEIKGFQNDLKDAKAAVANLVKDDKQLDKLEAQVEKKYGDLGEAPPKVADKVENLQEEVGAEKTGLQEAFAAVGDNIEETKAQIEELKGEIADGDLSQEDKLLQQCDRLLQQLTKTDAGFDKLETKVGNVEVEASHG